MAPSKTLQKRREALEAERAGLVSAIGAIEAEHAALSDTLPHIQATAERTGAKRDVAARDQAEAQIAALELDMQRKRAALAAVTGDLDAMRADLAAQQRETWLQHIQDVRQEAGAVADQLDHDLLSVELWARLWELYARFGALRSQIAAGGGFPPGATYGQRIQAPDKALAVRLDTIREFEAALRKPGHHVRGPLTMRAALGLDTV